MYNLLQRTVDVAVIYNTKPDKLLALRHTKGVEGRTPSTPLRHTSTV